MILIVSFIVGVSKIKIKKNSKLMTMKTIFFWYCRPPVIGGVWSKSAFGVYTPCAIDSLVLSISHMLLLALCMYRIWLIFYKYKSQRFCFKSNIFNYFLSFLATYFAIEPLFKLIAKIPIFNLDAQQPGFAPFEVYLIFFFFL